MSSSSIWDEIDLSESYLVCSMFDKAASVASSVLKHIVTTSDDSLVEDDIQLADMMESAGMVLVQSLKELGRTSDIMEELKALFISVTRIPSQVLLTGACFQISDGYHDGLCESLNEFLGTWSYGDGHYVFLNPEQNRAYLKGSSGHYILEMDKYFEIAEVYTLTLLGGALNNIDLALTWVEKADLPDYKRQDIIRRLRSLFELKATKTSQYEDLPLQARKNEENPVKETVISGAGDTVNETLPKFTKVEPWFWFRSINLKFGNSRFSVSHGKIALWGSFIFMCLLLQKKQAGSKLKQIARRRASSVKKALVDLWQLAFSVQVNPLAAIQPLPSAARGGRS